MDAIFVMVIFTRKKKQNPHFCTTIFAVLGGGREARSEAGVRRTPPPYRGGLCSKRVAKEIVDRVRCRVGGDRLDPQKEGTGRRRKGTAGARHDCSGRRIGESVFCDGRVSAPPLCGCVVRRRSICFRLEFCALNCFEEENKTHAHGKTKIGVIPACGHKCNGKRRLAPYYSLHAGLSSFPREHIGTSTLCPLPRCVRRP